MPLKFSNGLPPHEISCRQDGSRDIATACHFQCMSVRHSFQAPPGRILLLLQILKYPFFPVRITFHFSYCHIWILSLTPTPFSTAIQSFLLDTVTLFLPPRCIDILRGALYSAFFSFSFFSVRSVFRDIYRMLPSRPDLFFILWPCNRNLVPQLILYIQRSTLRFAPRLTKA